MSQVTLLISAILLSTVSNTQNASKAAPADSRAKAGSSSTMPVFIGDVNEYLSSVLVYPVRPRQKNIQGRVIVHFVVNEDGAISNVDVSRSSDNAELDEEAMRVVRGMPKWKAGMQDGEAVKVNFWLPITFQLK